jgi:hypothetical protein
VQTLRKLWEEVEGDFLAQELRKLEEGDFLAQRCARRERRILENS